MTTKGALLRPSSLDALVFGYLEVVIQQWSSENNSLARQLHSCTNLKQFCNRVHQNCFPALKPSRHSCIYTACYFYCPCDDRTSGGCHYNYTLKAFVERPHIVAFGVRCSWHFVPAGCKSWAIPSSARLDRQKLTT